MIHDTVLAVGRKVHEVELRFPETEDYGRETRMTWENRLPALKARLRSEDPVVRRTAASVLGFMGPVARDASRALARALDDQDPIVRRLAARALGRMGLVANNQGLALIGVL